MASTAATTMRHSFLDHTGAERAEQRSSKLQRTPSLPSQFRDKKRSSQQQKKRPSGLFESSESSGEEGDESAHEYVEDTDHVAGRPEHFATSGGEHGGGRYFPRTSSEVSSNERVRGSRTVQAVRTSLSMNSGPERKGLFEMDDDADSVETLRERVKLRQKKKESDMSNLKREMERALARRDELEAELVAAHKEKDEFAIRMNECQRIIEKRNNQLIKASAKVARMAEQTESQVSELQQKIQELTLEVARTRAEEKALQEKLRHTFEEKLEQQRNQFEAQVERLTQLSAETLQRKDLEEAALRKRVKNLEADVVTATSRVAESEEYRILLKRWEDAEAISRGLRFQLEKAQQEKKYLKKQLQNQAGTGVNVPFVPSSESLFSELSSTVPAAHLSPASSAASASADLSNFDFYPPPISPPRSPTFARAPSSSTSTSSASRKASLKVPTSEPLTRAPVEEENGQEDTNSKGTLASQESVFGSTNEEDDEDQSPPPPPVAVEDRPRPGSGSINFFEKLSFKFKRSTSPRNTLNVKTDDKERHLNSTSSVPSTPSQSTAPAATLPINIPRSRTSELKKRPKMYIAKSPSDYEESSDSIFGSDSESDDSSSDDGSEPPPPPQRDQTAQSPVPHTIPSVPPPPPPLVIDQSDEEAESSSHSDDANDEEDETDDEAEDLRRVIPPMQPSPPSLDSRQSRDQEHFRSSQDKFSHLSGSESAKSDHEKARSVSPPIHANVRTMHAPNEVDNFSSSESSDSDVPTRDKRGRLATDETSNKTKESSPTTRKEKRDRSRSSEGGAAPSAAASAKISRMNEYMEARAKKRQEKLKKKELHEDAEHKKREEYEKEWERMAQEERERRRKQQKTRRTGKRRPSSMKTVRVSQMRQQMSKLQHSKDQPPGPGDEYDENDDLRPAPSKHRDDLSSDSSDSDSEHRGRRSSEQLPGEMPPLPPEPTAADTDLYMRQQARLRERHEQEMKKKLDAEEADQVRGQIHRRVEMWAFAKELLHMILTLDQISSNEALRQCQMMVVQSPDPETLRKTYRNIIRVIHPDKLRGATISEQLEAKELFTVLNQAFEKFKSQN